MSTIRQPPGLVDVSTQQLEHLLRMVHRGEADCPLTPTELARVRLQPVALAIMRHLRGLDDTAVKAVLVAILAERRVFEQQREREAASLGPVDSN